MIILFYRFLKSLIFSIESYYAYERSKSTQVWPLSYSLDIIDGKL